MSRREGREPVSSSSYVPVGGVFPAIQRTRSGPLPDDATGSSAPKSVSALGRPHVVAIYSVGPGYPMTQTPDEQVFAAGQTTPQAPQLFSSDDTSTHCAPHCTRGAGQEPPTQS